MKIRSTPYTFADLTNRETLLVTVTADADDDATIALDTLLTTFADAIVYSDGVSATERRMALACSESLVDDLFRKGVKRKYALIR